MLKDAIDFKYIYICTGFTYLRRDIDGHEGLAHSLSEKNLAASGNIYLFLKRRNDRMKALLYGGDGWFFVISVFLMDALIRRTGR